MNDFDLRHSDSSSWAKQRRVKNTILHIHTIYSFFTIEVELNTSYSVLYVTSYLQTKVFVGHYTGMHRTFKTMNITHSEVCKLLLSKVPEQ